MKPNVIAMINQKGGVGKTSTCMHLTTPFVELGKRVLLVDMDPQANLTQGIFGSAETESLHPSVTIAAVFSDDQDPDPKTLVQKTHIEGVDIVPGSWHLNDYDYPQASTHGEYQFSLRNFLGEIEGDYDIVLIDCRPSLNLLSWNALLASTHLMVPFQPEDYGAQGIVYIQRCVDQVVAGPNPKLRLLGYLLTKVARRSLHRTFETILRNFYGEDVFENMVMDATQYPEAVSHHLPVGVYKKKSKQAQAMRDLATEVLMRVEEVKSRSPRFLYMGNRSTPNQDVVTEPIRKVG